MRNVLCPQFFVSFLYISSTTLLFFAYNKRTSTYIHIVNRVSTSKCAVHTSTFIILPYRNNKNGRVNEWMDAAAATTADAGDFWHFFWHKMNCLVFYLCSTLLFTQLFWCVPFLSFELDFTADVTYTLTHVTCTAHLVVVSAQPCQYSFPWLSS